MGNLSSFPVGSFHRGLQLPFLTNDTGRLLLANKRLQTKREEQWWWYGTIEHQMKPLCLCQLVDDFAGTASAYVFEWVNKYVKIESLPGSVKYRWIFKNHEGVDILAVLLRLTSLLILDISNAGVAPDKELENNLRMYVLSVFVFSVPCCCHLRLLCSMFREVFILVRMPRLKEHAEYALYINS